MTDRPLIPAPKIADLASYPDGSWPLISHLRLPAVAQSVPVARQHARAQLRGWGFDETWAVEIVVTELCANAVAVSMGMIRLWLCSDQDAVLVMVWDAADDMPVRRDGGLDTDGGRGLVIVEALSKDFNWYRPAAVPGKVVWSIIA